MQKYGMWSERGSHIWTDCKGGGDEATLKYVGRRRMVDPDSHGREQKRSSLMAVSCHNQQECVAGCLITHPSVTILGRPMQNKE